MALPVQSEWAVRTEGLTKLFGTVRALDSLDLRVPVGRIYGFVGPNGSGKTTAIAILLGLMRPTRGRVELFGTPQGSPEYSDVLSRVGALVQAPAFYPFLSGRDNLRVLGATRRSLSDREIEEALERVGLRDRADHRYHTYSFGMRQRLAIALALLGSPRLVVLDEPTNGLDPVGIQEVRQLIRELGRAGLTVFLSSHLLHEVEQVCDEVGVIVQGRLVAQGSVAELLRSRGLRLRVKGTDSEGGDSDSRNGELAREAAECLARLPWRPRVSVVEDALWVEAPPERAAELTRALAARGMWVSEMVPVRSTLEQYFLEVAAGGAPGDGGR